MIKYKILIICLINFIWGLGSYEFCNFPTDPISLSLSSSSEAFERLYFQNNPANISLKSAKYRYSFLILPSNIYSFEIQNKIIKNSNVLIGKITSIDYGSILDSQTNKKHSAYDILFEIAYKREFKNILSIGGSIGNLFSSIAGYQSNLLISNVGLKSRLFNKRLGMAISIENLKLSYKGYTHFKEKIPKIIRSSMYYKFKYIPTIINISFINNVNYKINEIALGIEHSLSRKIILRFGLSSKRNTFITGNFSSDIQAALSGGISFKLYKYSFDLGFMNIGSAGYILGLSLSNIK